MTRYFLRVLCPEVPARVAEGWLVRARTFPPSLPCAVVTLEWGGVGEPPGYQRSVYA